MSTDPDRAGVAQQLVAMGYEVAEIPTSTNGAEVADLRATREAEPTLIIEVKARQESSAFLEELSAISDAQVLSPGPRSLAYSGSISDKIAKAASQIDSSRRAFDQIGVLWVRVTDASLVDETREQLLSTLLGKTYAWTDQPALIPAYFVGRTRFAEHREIDVVVFEGHEIVLLPDRAGNTTPQERHNYFLLCNPFSMREPICCLTTLFTEFRAAGFVLPDPIHQERRGEALTLNLDAHVDRADEAQVVAALNRKYPGLQIKGVGHLSVHSVWKTVQLERHHGRA